MEFLSKESLQRIADKSDLLEHTKANIGAQEKAIFEGIENLSVDGDVSMDEESEDQGMDVKGEEKMAEVSKEEIEWQAKLCQILEVQRDTHEDKERRRNFFHVLPYFYGFFLSCVRRGFGFESTQNLEESRKKVGLEVFERIFKKADLYNDKFRDFSRDGSSILSKGNEQGECFSYNSWLEIEYQCSQELNKINIEMNDRLKQHNLDSLCGQIDNHILKSFWSEYTSENANILDEDLTDSIAPPFLKEEIEFDRDLEYIFEDLRHLEMLDRECKIKYCEDEWLRLDDETKSNIKLIMSSSFPGFSLDMTTLHPDVSTNPLSIFHNDIIDTLYINLKELEIKISKREISARSC